MKSILSIFLALLPFVANADAVEIDGIWYNLISKGKAAEVTKPATDKYSGAIEIPDKVNYDGTDYSVTSIGDNAFAYCSSLTSVTIPNSVTSIGGSAFSHCSSLTSVTIPNSVTSIEEFAYYGCGGLTSITIPNSVTSIGNNAFSGCSGLTSITIPNSVTNIVYTAFQSCDGLTSIIVQEGNSRYDSPNNCNAIIEKESNVLIKGCNNSTIPEGVKSISYYAFWGCSGLTSITIPNSVTSIGSYAFYGCSSLTSITIPDGVTSIETSTFNGCSGLTSITIPNCVTSIGEFAFGGCSGLNSITIPNSVTSIGSLAFYECSSLTSITIPNSVASIGYSAFKGCSSLTSVTIPNSVTSIGSQAFSSCYGLNSVYVDIKEPLAIEPYTFNLYYNFATLYVPVGCREAYESSDYWKGFREIKEFVKDVEIVFAKTEYNTVTATTANDQTVKEIIIPECVMINNGAYSVTSIGDEAFKDNTALSVVCIPETIEEIGADAFAGCSGLKAIYSYAEEPIAIGSAKATVRTRADGEETSASAVFTNVDKETCILYVPKNSSDKYRNAAGWKEFHNIVEMQSAILGDANNDAEVDGKDVEATTSYIMEGKTENFIFKNADVKTDSKINAADIVQLVNLIR